MRNVRGKIKGMSGTVQGTAEITDDDASLAMWEPPEQPPCRKAALHVVMCPVCGRQLQIKTLRYSHICGRSFKPRERAVDQKKAADTAILARMAHITRMQEHAAQPIQTQERSAESKQWHFSIA